MTKNNICTIITKHGYTLRQYPDSMIITVKRPDNMYMPIIGKLNDATADSIIVAMGR